MSSHPPPVPPEQRSAQGEAGKPSDAVDATQEKARTRDRNLAEQGRQGNIKQNTTHQGHQQDR